MSNQRPAEYKITDEQIHAQVRRRVQEYDLERALETHPQYLSELKGAKNIDVVRPSLESQIIGKGESKVFDSLEAFHVAAVKSMVGQALKVYESVEEPVHLIVAGPSGSGKTTLTKALISTQEEVKDNPEMEAIRKMFHGFNKGNMAIFDESQNPFSFPPLFDKVAKNAPATGYDRADHSNTFWKVRPYCAAIMETAREVYQQTLKASGRNTDKFEESLLDTQPGSASFEKMMEILRASREEDGRKLVIVGFATSFEDRVERVEARAKAGGRGVDKMQTAQSHSNFLQNAEALEDVADDFYLIDPVRQQSRLMQGIFTASPASVSARESELLDRRLVENSEVIYKKVFDTILFLNKDKCEQFANDADKEPEALVAGLHSDRRGLDRS